LLLPKPPWTTWAVATLDGTVTRLDIILGQDVAAATVAGGRFLAVVRGDG
jgi:hypothetical protein